MHGDSGLPATAAWERAVPWERLTQLQHSEPAPPAPPKQPHPQVWTNSARLTWSAWAPAAAGTRPSWGWTQTTAARQTAAAPAAALPPAPQLQQPPAPDRRRRCCPTPAHCRCRCPAPRWPRSPGWRRCPVAAKLAPARCGSSPPRPPRPSGAGGLGRRLGRRRPCHPLPTPGAAGLPSLQAAGARCAASTAAASPAARRRTWLLA